MRIYETGLEIIFHHFSSQYLEIGQITTLNCKGAWEMFSYSLGIRGNDTSDYLARLSQYQTIKSLEKAESKQRNLLINVGKAS